MLYYYFLPFFGCFVVKKVPGGQNAQVAVGASVLLGICAIPVFMKNERRGHDLFSQEKPEAIVESQEKARKEYLSKQ